MQMSAVPVELPSDKRKVKKRTTIDLPVSGYPWIYMHVSPQGGNEIVNDGTWKDLYNTLAWKPLGSVEEPDGDQAKKAGGWGSVSPARPLILRNNT
jgi:hypothetical protein